MSVARASGAAAVAAAEGFVIDVDGCLVLSDRPGGVGGGIVIPGAAELIGALKANGKRVLACTNGSSGHPRTYASGLRAAGIEIEDEEMLTPLVAGVRQLARDHPGARVLSLGGEAMRAALEEAGIELADADSAPAPDAVFVGWSERYTQAELSSACRAVADGAAFLVTARSPWFASRAGRGVGLAGAISAGIEYVSGVAPTVVGKPSTTIMDAAAELLGVAPERMAVIGDDPVAEIEMGNEHGASTVLVLSGITAEEAIPDLPPGRRPDLVVANVGELGRMLFAEAA